MIGRIQYTVTAVSEPMRSTYHMAAPYDANVSPWADVALNGETQDIYLDWGYISLDRTRKDTRHVNQVALGYTEVISHGTRKGHRFAVELVARIRQTGLADDYEVLSALNDHLEAGSATWWPDWDNFPTEAVTIVAGNITPPKRHGKFELFTFSFEFDELPLNQAPTTIPAFV